MSEESVTEKISRAFDWWYAARWREFLTWMALAAVSNAAVMYRSGGLLDKQIEVLGAVLQKLGIPVVPFAFLKMFTIMALLSWYQPVVLRVGAIRSGLWIIGYCVLFFILLWCANVLSVSNRVQDALILGNLCGVSGLLAIGVRTRAWLTLVGGALSVTVSLLMMQAFSAPSGLALNFSLVMLSQAVYAAVMIWGTQRIERRGDAEESGMLCADSKESRKGE